MKARAVFDCMVYLQAAARRHGPAAACLRLALAGQIELCVSTPIIDEVRGVLSRDKLRRKFPALTDAAVDALLGDIQTAARSLDPVPAAFQLPRDPKDEKYVDAILAAGGGYLVTRDRDLLDLMNDSEFRANYPGVTILDPAAFLNTVAAP